MPKRFSDEVKTILSDSELDPVYRDVLRETASPQMATAFNDWIVDSSDIAADDAADFLVVSRSIEGKKLQTYLKLKRTIGKQLADAAREYNEYRERTMSLFEIVSESIDGRERISA